MFESCIFVYHAFVFQSILDSLENNLQTYSHIGQQSGNGVGLKKNNNL